MELSAVRFAADAEFVEFSTMTELSSLEATSRAKMAEKNRAILSKAAAESQAAKSKLLKQTAKTSC